MKAGEEGPSQSRQEGDDADRIREDKDAKGREEEKTAEEENQAQQRQGQDTAESSTSNVDNEGQVIEANTAK